MRFACDYSTSPLTLTTRRGCSCAGTADLGVVLVGGFSLLLYVNNQDNACHESCRGVLQLPVQAQVWAQTFPVVICSLPSHRLPREHSLRLKVPVRQQQSSCEARRDNRSGMVSSSGSYSGVMLRWFAQACTCRPGANLPVEVEWHRPVPKSWAAMSLSSIFLLNIFIEGLAGNISPVKRTCEKHVLSNKA